MNQSPLRRIGGHDNAFGVIRLVLASLVIVSHTPELADGNRHREPLTRLFHSVSFAELAVDGFFIVSGFLITASLLRNPDPIVYLRHRIARIYPAFIVSSLLCVLVLAPLVGGQFQRGPVTNAARVAGRVLLLSPPYVPGAFNGTPYPMLNGAAWTIQYEFLMYLLVLVLALVGRLRFGAVAFSAFVCLSLCALAPWHSASFLDHLSAHNYLFHGTGRDLFRLTGAFLVGSAFRLRWALLKPSLPRAAISLALAGLCLFLPILALPGFAIFGGYSLLSLAELGGGTIFARVNNRDDISYGLYLYGWPIGKLMLWANFPANLFVIGVATWLLSLVAGAASWFLVERWAIDWSRSTRALATA